MAEPSDVVDLRRAIVRQLVRVEFGPDGNAITVRLDNWIGETVI